MNLDNMGTGNKKRLSIAFHVALGQTHSPIEVPSSSRGSCLSDCIPNMGQAGSSHQSGFEGDQRVAAENGTMILRHAVPGKISPCNGDDHETIRDNTCLVRESSCYGS